MDTLANNMIIIVPAKSEKVNYRRPGFISKFLELQGVMCEKSEAISLI